MAGAKIGPTLRVLMLGEVGIPNVTEMNDNDLSIIVLHEDRFLLRIRSHALDLARRIQRNLTPAPCFTFLGEGGFHGNSFSASTACLYSSEFLPNS